MKDTTSNDAGSKPDGPRGKEPVAELRNVTKAFDGHEVLRGVSLSIDPGETFVIIGSSGTGKSVTIKHIVGLLRPDSGTIRVFQQDPWALTRSERNAMRLRMGYLFQSGALLNWMTIEENVGLPLVEHRRRLSAQDRRQIILDKLRLVQMESARAKFPAEVSGGMKKRAALARAIVLDPEIILYDEPTSGLDPVISNTINELILNTQRATGATQVVVTHDMESAYKIADRIAMLYRGRIIATGTPDEIRTSSNPIVQQFITGDTSGPLSEEESEVEGERRF